MLESVGGLGGGLIPGGYTTIIWSCLSWLVCMAADGTASVTYEHGTIINGAGTRHVTGIDPPHYSLSES